MPVILKNIGKLNCIVLVAALVTLVLFYSMQLLIMADQEMPVAVEPTIIPDITMPEIKFEVVTTTPKPVEPEVPPEIPDRLPRIVDEGGPEIFDPTPFQDTDVPIDTGFNPWATDSNAIPVAQIQPQYPESAARRGLEGFVIVEFDVNEVGAVINPEILGSVPEGIFDRAALRALERWRYQPKMVDGQPVSMRGLQTRFTFSLEK